MSSAFLSYNLHCIVLYLHQSVEVSSLIFKLHSGFTYMANRLTDFSLQLNSWQESRLNEPDFELRDDGYKEAIRILAEPELDVNFLLMIVHNCCYFAATVGLVLLRQPLRFCILGEPSAIRMRIVEFDEYFS